MIKTRLLKKTLYKIKNLKPITPDNIQCAIILIIIYTVPHLKSSANNISRLMTLQEREKNLQLTRNHLIITPSRLWQLAPVMNDAFSELLCTYHHSKASKTFQKNTYGRKRYINLSEKMPACEPMKFSFFPAKELIGGEWGELHLIQVQAEKVWSTSTPTSFMDTSMLFSKQQQRGALPLASSKMGFLKISQAKIYS